MEATEAAAWIAAVSATSALAGTVGSLIYQGRQLRDQQRLLRRQAEFLSLQSRELLDVSSRRIGEQALRVKMISAHTRLVPRLLGDYPPIAERPGYRSNESAVICSAHVVNDSDEIIKQIEVRFGHDEYARWVRVNDNATILDSPLTGLGPGRSAWFDSNYLGVVTDEPRL
jgi:hypothetical protein